MKKNVTESVTGNEEMGSSVKEEEQKESSSMDSTPQTKDEKESSKDKEEATSSTVNSKTNEASEGGLVSSLPNEVDVHNLRYSSLQIIYELANELIK